MNSQENSLRDKLACAICNLCSGKITNESALCRSSQAAADRALAFLFTPAQLAALQDGTGRISVVRDSVYSHQCRGCNGTGRARNITTKSTTNQCESCNGTGQIVDSVVQEVK